MSESWPRRYAYRTPRSMRAWFGEHLNAIRLFYVPRRRTSFSRLMKLDQIDLGGILAPRPFEEEWQSVENKVRVAIETNGSSEHSSNPGDKRALYQFVRHLRPRTALEIGTAYAVSALYIGLAMRQNALLHGGEPGRLTTLDIVDIDGPLRSRGPRRSPRTMIADAGIGDLVEFVTCDSPKFLATTNHRFDFVYIDGSTGAAGVYRNLQNLPRVLDTDAVVLLHTFYPNGQPLWPGEPAITGPWRALRRLEAEGTGIAVRHLGELPWPTKRGTRVTSLALIGRAPNRCKDGLRFHL